MKLLLLACMLVTCSQAYEDYSGYQTIEIIPRSEYEQDFIEQLKYDEELDFWLESRVLGRPVHIMVPPHRIKWINTILQDTNLDHRVLVSDVGENVAAEKSRLLNRNVKIQAYNNSDFNNYTEIMNQLDLWAADCPSDFTCTVDTLGQSYEGKDIKRFTIGKDRGRAYWMDSAIHAREWLSPATNLRILEHMVTNYDTDADVERLLDAYDWMFIPVMNPDGYEFSWTDARYWRKSRNENLNSTCNGTDLNRNYDAAWGVSGTSDEPCQFNYKGEYAASAPETQVIQTEIDRIWPTLEGSVSIHTYGYYMLHPYGHENETDSGFCVFAPTHDKLYAVAEAMVNAIYAESTNASAWTYGNSCEAIYPASGLTMDYIYSQGSRVPYTFTPELRGQDFVIDPSEIEPSFREIWAAIVAMVDTIAAQP